MKKFIAILLSVIMVFSSFSFSIAADDDYSTALISENPNASDTISVVLNDQIIDFTDENGNVVNPLIINGRTMVPMRKIFEVFGAQVSWDGETQTVTANTEEKELVLQIDNSTATVKTVSGEEKIELDSAPVIVDGRTLVPVRFIAESLDLRVGWDGENRVVAILDTAPLYEKVKTEAPTFYEFITTEFTSETTGEATIKGTGEVSYKNSKEKTSNTNLKFTLTGDSKVNEEAVSANIDLKTTGKGSLIESIKEAGLDKFDMKLIATKDFTTFIKSSLLESEYGTKWVKILMSEDEIAYLKEYVENASSYEGASYKDIIEMLIDYVPVTPTTYYELEEIFDVVCDFVDDAHFTVSGRTSKTYSYNLALEDIFDIVDLGLTNEEKKELLNLYNGALSFEVKVDENNTVQNAKFNLSIDIKEDYETVDLKIDVESSLKNSGSKVTITIPSDKDVVVAEF